MQAAAARLAGWQYHSHGPFCRHTCTRYWKDGEMETQSNQKTAKVKMQHPKAGSKAWKQADLHCNADGRPGMLSVQRWSDALPIPCSLCLLTFDIYCNGGLAEASACCTSCTSAIRTSWPPAASESRRVERSGTVRTLMLKAGPGTNNK